MTTTQLLFALILAIAPYVPGSGLKPDHRAENYYAYSPTELIDFSRRTCRALATYKAIEVTKDGELVSASSVLDPMLETYEKAGIDPIKKLSRRFQKKIEEKLGLNYPDTIKFVLSICKENPSDEFLPTQQDLNAARRMLTDIQTKVADYIYDPKNPPSDMPQRTFGQIPHQFFLEDGTSVYTNTEKKEPFTWTPFETFPELFVKGLIASEDKTFWSHPGIDLTSVIRAAYRTIMKNSFEGGSTLTQQLVKNIYRPFSDPEFADKKNPRMRRKLAEYSVVGLLTGKAGEPLPIELLGTIEYPSWGRINIIEHYLNLVNFGRGTGAAQAAELLFGEDIAALDLRQLATLAAMTKKPTRYVKKDEDSFELLKNRQHYVLKRLREEGHITEDEEQAARLGDTLQHYPFIDPPKQNAQRTFSPYRDFIGAAKLDEAFQVYKKDFAVSATLTMDKDLQDLAASALKEGLLAYEGRKQRKSRPYDVPRVQGAVVIIDHQTGAVKAIQGGTLKIYNDDGKVVEREFDFARRGARQPGSTMKPFTYLMALENGISPTHEIPNRRPELPPLPGANAKWSARNYDGSYGGSRTVEDGLAESINLVTLQLLKQVDFPDPYGNPMSLPLVALDQVREWSKKFHVYCDIGEVSRGECPAGMSIPDRKYTWIFGTQETTLLRMTTAYAMIANGGKVVKPHFIQSMLLEEYEDDRPTGRRRAITRPTDFYERLPLKPATLPQLKDMLELVVSKRGGTAYTLRSLAGKVAGKTGTTSRNKDAWFVGYTSRFAIGVWVGYVGKRATTLGAGESGNSVAAPIFKKIVAQLDLEPLPDNIIVEPPAYAAPYHQPVSPAPPVPQDLPASSSEQYQPPPREPIERNHRSERRRPYEERPPMSQAPGGYPLAAPRVYQMTPYPHPSYNNRRQPQGGYYPHRRDDSTIFVPSSDPDFRRILEDVF